MENYSEEEANDAGGSSTPNRVDRIGNKTIVLEEEVMGHLGINWLPEHC